jgi:non-ribosomal peptide synthetase component F
MNMTTLSGPKRPDLLRDELLHDIFILTAARFPNKVALHWQDEQITYHQLHQQALQMAVALHRTKQIGPGRIVGIRLSRSAELHVTIIAILMTGAIYVPFDADTPQERVSEVIADLKAVLLIVDAETSIDHPLALNIQTLSKGQTTTENDNLSVNISPVSAAYIICTSGSTGKPKSIAISHRSICHLVRAENEVMQIKHDDIVYQGFSVAFDMFFEETFLAYLVGATLVIASKSDVLNTDCLHLFFIRHSITVLNCVPTLLLLMNNDPALKLRLINTGGEACPQVCYKIGGADQKF